MVLHFHFDSGNFWNLGCKDPLVNEFYDELQKHWRLLPTAPVIVIDDQDEDENEVDLTEFFESVKAEIAGDEGGGGGAEVVPVGIEEDAYLTQEDPYLAHLEFQVEEASKLKGDAEAPVAAAKGDAEAPVAVADAGQVLGNVKETSGEVGVEEQPHTTPKPDDPTTPKGPVVKVPFTPTPKMSDQEITERIARLKFLVCNFQNCFRKACVKKNITIRPHGFQTLSVLIGLQL